MIKLISYRKLRTMLPKEDILDMVWFRIIKPVEKSAYPNSWKFKVSDVGIDNYKKLLARREERYATICNSILAEDIESEWSHKKKEKSWLCGKCDKKTNSLYSSYSMLVCGKCNTWK